VKDFNIPLSPIDRSSKQKKINKEILELNHTIDQMDLADVYGIFHPTSAQYTFFSVAHRTFFKIDHILGHKASLSKYKKVEIIPCTTKTTVESMQTIGSQTHCSMINASLMK
jgi:exonuclease III